MFGSDIIMYILVVGNVSVRGVCDGRGIRANWGEGGFPSGRRWSLFTWVLGTLAWADCPFFVMSQS